MFPVANLPFMMFCGLQRLICEICTVSISPSGHSFSVSYASVSNLDNKKYTYARLDYITNEPFYSVRAKMQNTNEIPNS